MIQIKSIMQADSGLWAAVCYDVDSDANGAKEVVFRYRVMAWAVVNSGGDDDIEPVFVGQDGSLTCISKLEEKLRKEHGQDLVGFGYEIQDAKGDVAK